MQPGSLVVCIQYCKGLILINGEYIRAVRDICKGEILTVNELIPQHTEVGPTGKMSLEFVEIDRFIHPICNIPCGYPTEHFREIQPPMEVDIEKITKKRADV